MVGQQGMKIQDGVPSEAALSGRIHEKCDGCLAVQDCPRFELCLAFGHAAKDNQLLLAFR